VCGLHRAQGDEECRFLDLTIQPWSTVSSDLTSKYVATVSPGLASKLMATVSLGFTSKSVATVHMVWPQNHSLGFPSLGFKTGSCGLVIWPTKSPQQFLSLGLKTKWVMVCRLRHKTDGRMKIVHGTRRDLAALFTWKQVRLGVFSLASRLVEARRGWCT
jgi:hypothetical protein